MVTKTVDISEARTQLPELLGLALAGVEVLILDGDQPLTKFMPLSGVTGRRFAGLNQGAVWISDDFDDPLPDEFWTSDDDPLTR